MKTESAVEAQAVVAEMRLHTRRALAGAGLRLARALAVLEPEVIGIAAAAGFAERWQAELGPAAALAPAGHPLLRLEQLLPPAATRLALDLLLLACLPETHEAFAAVCRALHPQGLPLPTPALALRWLAAEEAPGGATDALRDEVEDLLCRGALARAGLFRLEGDGPWHSRGLRPGAGIWAALSARAPLPGEGADLVGGLDAVPGLAAWLALPGPAQAVAALRRGLPCHVLLVGGDAAMRATRVRALLGAARVAALRLRGAATPIEAAALAAWLQNSALWLERADGDRPTADAEPAADAMPALPVLQSAAEERALQPLALPQVRVPVTPLAPAARRALWRTLLPPLAAQAHVLAARYPIEPEEARAVVRDLGLRRALAGAAPLALDDVADCIRQRTPWHALAGVRRVAPQAGWSRLLLPPDAQRQLRAAVQRVAQQLIVLDDWGFEQGAGGRRGVRLLFCGPPGTGKTLAAEAMAHEIGVDLLVVDLSSLVSKWLGETEKNLEAVFTMAERARALLLFDEADALFGRRTEAQDAHDRYANLETAYLLQRLERYEGVAVLTTNLSGNIDPAFARRFEAIVDFPEPDAATRRALWQRHLPEAAPLDADVDVGELASWYAITGAQIRNAALGAAFLAAAEGRAIARRDFLQAIEREYGKAGRAHPGHPPPRRPALSVSPLTA